MVHHFKKYGLQSIRVNNSVSRLFFPVCFESTESKILFNLEVQGYTNRNLVLQERVQMLIDVSMVDYGCQHVVEVHESGNVFTDSHHNTVRQRSQFLCLAYQNELDFMNEKTLKECFEQLCGDINILVISFIIYFYVPTRLNIHVKKLNMFPYLVSVKSTIRVCSRSILRQIWV